MEQNYKLLGCIRTLYNAAYEVIDGTLSNSDALESRKQCGSHVSGDASFCYNSALCFYKHGGLTAY